MGLTAASAGGELCELERYELEFFKMPVYYQRCALRMQASGLPFGRSWCDEGECSGECAVMIARLMCGGWVF